VVVRVLKDQGAYVQVLQFVHGVIAQLADTGASAELALALFLDSAISASDVACLELIAYEFFEQVGPVRGTGEGFGGAQGWVGWW
jgi:hypothetical protein